MNDSWLRERICSESDTSDSTLLYLIMVQNKGLIFKKAPSGWPVAGEHIATEIREIDLEKDCPDGGIIVKNSYVSFDPYQRGRMRPPGPASYAAGFEIGKPISNRGIAKVVTSRSDKWKVGDVLIVEGTGTEEYTILTKERVSFARKLENPRNLDPKIFIGALGMPGLTAWASLYEIGNP